VGLVLYKLGRAMQLIGLLLVPLAIASNIAPERPATLAQSLWMSGIGVAVFIVGYGLQQLGRPNG
jgi:hypothetical protein